MVEEFEKSIDNATSTLEYANNWYLEEVEKKRGGVSIAKHFDTHFYVFARVKSIYKKMEDVLSNITDNVRETIKNKLERYITALNSVDRYEGKIEECFEELTRMLRRICEAFHITKFVGLLDGFVVDQRCNHIRLAPPGVNI
jgi:hypothetical protein